MIRQDKFVISKKLYAIDPHSLTRKPVGQGWSCAVSAAWFRRKNGRVVVYVGRLWDFQYDEPKTTTEFALALTDGRYGGNALASWNGHKFWGVDVTDQAIHELKRLRSEFFDNYGRVPEGLDGWWRFETPADRRES